AAALVFGRRQLLQFCFTAASSLLVKLLEERNAPAAASAGAAAFGELAGNFRTAKADEIHQLAPRHVKTVTNLGIQIHQPLTASFGNCTNASYCTGFSLGKRLCLMAER